MKRALIITYYWPPAGGPGVQRWLKFVKYFREFGIEPIVYIPQNPNYPLIDVNFEKEIPLDIEIIKQPIAEPYRFANIFSKKKTKDISSGIISNKNPSTLEKLMLYIRGNFFIPDARVGWVKPSVKYLSEYIPKNSIDFLITTGPPHSLHLIGMQLKKQLGIKWLADFRDPWTSIHYHKSLLLNKTSEKKHKKLEAAVLNNASRVVVTSPTTKAEFESITNTNIDVVTNGYDVFGPVETSLDIKFSISHIGSLLSERNPEILWDVLKEISKEDSHFKNCLQLKFAGVISEEVKNSLQEYGLLENALFLGYISHSEALKLQLQSQLLLLIEINSVDTRAIIPGKLFEYLAAKRPVIALGPEKSDIKSIIEETHSGFFFDYSEKKSMKHQILKCFEDYKISKLSISSKGIEKYSRKVLTSKMASILQDLK